MNLIEEKLEKYLNRFVKMKEERHSNFSFALYSTITCLFGIFIGQKISGIYLFYLAFILITAVPIIFRDEILGKTVQSLPGSVSEALGRPWTCPDWTIFSNSSVYSFI